jgi:UDP-N-acetylmuramoyl-tripeptide--D-alanyl-D-alanine ligase
MCKITVDDILCATSGKLIDGCRSESVTGVCVDTRLILEGELFVALAGERTDGHGFIHDAVCKGAGAILVSQLPNFDTRVPVILVPDTLDALASLATWYRNKFTGRVIAVTGSIGKTTTKDIIAAILAQGYTVSKSEGNLNTEIGLP